MSEQANVPDLASRRTHHPWASSYVPRFTRCGRLVTPETLIVPEAQRPTCKVCQRIQSIDNQSVQSAVSASAPR